MKAHDLARALLAGPDVPVAVALSEADDSSSAVDDVEIQVRRDDDGVEGEVAIVYFSYGTSTYDIP